MVDICIDLERGITRRHNLKDFLGVKFLPFLVMMSSHLAYIYFNQIRTDHEGKFTVDLKNKISSQASDFLFFLKTNNISSKT